MSTDPAPVQRLIGQLRELMSKATPGPWQNMDKTSVYDTPANNLLGWTNRGVDEAQWNAALIVAAINNLPALLEIAEASSRMENDAWEAHDGTDNWVVEDRHMVALSDALALLPNPQGSPGAAPVHPAVGRMQEQPETTEKGQ